ncbi:MAG: arylamine N-acetyltransferase [Thermoanaerobaculia bacterium]
MLPVDDILEALDLSRAEPGLGFLEALYSRFVSRVPFESATKILRNAAVADPAGKPRRPETFWQEHLASGAGGTCFARVAAFDTLLCELGFCARRVLGRVRVDFDHASLLVERDGRRWICDAGYPLPAILPAALGEHPTPRGALRIETTDRGLSIEFSDEVPEGPRRIEIFTAPVSENEFERRWRETFRPDADFLAGVKLLVERDNRKISFGEGAVRVDDLHTRLTVPLPSPRPRRLSEIFGVDEALLAGAFAVVGDPEPASPEASLTAYLETEAAPEKAFGAIATPEGYRALLTGVAQVCDPEPTAEGFRLRLTAPGGAPGQAGLEEEVAVDRRGLTLAVRRRAAASTSRSSFTAQKRDGKTYLIREALFTGAREDLLRNDALRGRLAGALAVDLLAWARLVSGSGT